ncbi:DoxX family protein [Streptomyces sp. NPDC060205]|uniref:DoxX family protein n=1 Tax=Streptomyces sp. NPDC060205 TaxID=3347072 RepID=UPI00366554F4
MSQNITSSHRTPATTSRPAHITAWVMQALLAAVFLFSGVTKWLGGEQTRQTFEEVGAGQWLRYVTGAIEIAGGVGLLVPFLAAFAALVLSGVMAGAALSEMVLINDGNPVIPLVVLVLCGVLVWLRRSGLSQYTARLSRPAPARTPAG